MSKLSDDEKHLAREYRDAGELEEQLAIMRRERNSTAHFLEHCGDRLEVQRRWQGEVILLLGDWIPHGPKPLADVAQRLLDAAVFTQDEEADQEEQA